MKRNKIPKSGLLDRKIGNLRYRTDSRSIHDTMCVTQV